MGRPAGYAGRSRSIAGELPVDGVVLVHREQHPGRALARKQHTCWLPVFLPRRISFMDFVCKSRGHSCGRCRHRPARRRLSVHLPTAQSSRQRALSTHGSSLRGRQGLPGGAIRETVRVLERIRRFRGAPLPRLWNGRSGFRKVEVRGMRGGKIANPLLQKKRHLPVMRQQTRGRFRRLSQG